MVAPAPFPNPHKMNPDPQPWLQKRKWENGGKNIFKRNDNYNKGEFSQRETEEKERLL